METLCGIRQVPRNKGQPRLGVGGLVVSGSRGSCRIGECQLEPLRFGDRG